MRPRWILPPVFALVLSGYLLLAASGGRSRSAVSRVKSDMRSCATALESFHVDHKRYPPHSPAIEHGALGRVPLLTPESLANSRGVGMPSFSLTELPNLTTPIAYIASHFPDPLNRAKGMTFGYWTDGEQGWILISTGPDGDYDLNPPEKFYDALSERPSARLLERTYDPTNGVASDGDIWRAAIRSSQAPPAPSPN